MTLDELTRRKKEKEAEIKHQKERAHRDGFRVTSNPRPGGEELANAIIRNLQDELRKINEALASERSRKKS